MASSVCKSLQYLTSALTQEGEGGHLFRLTCSVVLWRGRNTANKYHWHVWGVLTVSGPHRVWPRSQRVCFHGLHSSGSRLLCWNSLRWALGCVHFPGLSHSGSGSQVLDKGPDGWASVLCPSQVRAAQVTRCLASALTPRWGLRLITSPVPAAWFSGCTMGAPSRVCCVSPLGG